MCTRAHPVGRVVHLPHLRPHLVLHLVLHCCMLMGVAVTAARSRACSLACPQRPHQRLQGETSARKQGTLSCVVVPRVVTPRCRLCAASWHASVSNISQRTIQGAAEGTRGPQPRVDSRGVNTARTPARMSPKKTSCDLRNVTKGRGSIAFALSGHALPTRAGQANRGDEEQGSKGTKERKD